MVTGKTAFLFAGQGSQHIGMGNDLRDFAEATKIFSTAREIRPNIFEIINGAEEELNKTVNAQFAIFTHDLAVAEILRANGIKADCAAGHSVGEIPALVFAGILEPRAGFELIDVRSRSMQEAVRIHGGTMVAVLKIKNAVAEQVARGFDDAWAVNFNSPEQTVCACSEARLYDLTDAMTKAGGRVMRLKVNGAFHCPYMHETSVSLARALMVAQIKNGTIPVYANMTAQPYDGEVANLISKQVCSPVLWTQTITNMLRDGVTTFIEVGPGSVLSGLVKKIIEADTAINANEIRIYSASDAASIETVIKELKK